MDVAQWVREQARARLDRTGFQEGHTGRRAAADTATSASPDKPPAPVATAPAARAPPGRAAATSANAQRAEDRAMNTASICYQDVSFTARGERSVRTCQHDQSCEIELS